MEKQDRDERSLQGPTHYKANSCNHGEVANQGHDLEENFHSAGCCQESHL